MAERDPIDWDTCEHEGCIGFRLPTGGRCWAHAADDDAQTARKRLGEDGVLDARGVMLPAGLLLHLLADAPHDDQGRSVLTHARFDRATFQDAAGFDGTVFRGDSWFDEARFEGPAWFHGVTFQGSAVFDSTTFQGYATFDEATFKKDAYFHDVTFQDDVTFESAIFGGNASFRDTTFQEGVVFRSAAFHADASFGGAAIIGDAWFGEAIFHRDAMFLGTAFQANAAFDEAIFHRDAMFDGLTFPRGASFHKATFHGAASFFEVTFQDDASFHNAAFHADAWFYGAAFRRDAVFSGVTFKGSTGFASVTFHRTAGFTGATFERARQLGPVLVRKSLVLDRAVFHERIQVEVSAAALCCRRSRFLNGTNLLVRWAQVTVDDADLAAPSILTGVPAFPDLDESRLVPVWRRLRGTDTPEGRPRLVSLRRADVAGLTVANLDLRACRFAGAHHLDRLRIEEADLPATPRRWRLTNRQTIAEEHHWRAARAHPDNPGITNHDDAMAARQAAAADRRDGWVLDAHQPPAWLEVEQPSPAQVAALYRALRKGREDNKDEPGAADFYYGEMEMRRHAKHPRFQRQHPSGARTTLAAMAEYAVLWLYWLFSGYGLRAWRAFATLAAVVLVASGIFAFWGFAAPDQPAVIPVAIDAHGAPIYARQPTQRPAGLDELPGAIRFSAQAATALLRGPDRPLTPLGEWLHMTLRLTGPVLLGLAVLAIRGRIKR